MLKIYKWDWVRMGWDGNLWRHLFYEHRSEVLITHVWIIASLWHQGWRGRAITKRPSKLFELSSSNKNVKCEIREKKLWKLNFLIWFCCLATQLARSLYDSYYFSSSNIYFEKICTEINVKYEIKKQVKATLPAGNVCTQIKANFLIL